MTRRWRAFLNDTHIPHGSHTAASVVFDLTIYLFGLMVSSHMLLANMTLRLSIVQAAVAPLF